jgi:hypothetical protein
MPALFSSCHEGVFAQLFVAGIIAFTAHNDAIADGIRTNNK